MSQPNYAAVDFFSTDEDETPGRITPLRMEAVSRPAYTYSTEDDLRAENERLTVLYESYRSEVVELRRRLHIEREAAQREFDAMAERLAERQPLCRVPTCRNEVAETGVRCSACRQEQEGE